MLVFEKLRLMFDDLLIINFKLFKLKLLLNFKFDIALLIILFNV